ncbi:hypothetical protein BKA66DRAFT_547666 [Pyrenochaeta sp. MPI-SDFR-AT-0127]|nr:hypothetical protein BKA66DRAFT_547666 [Pyrenochaeta sp. MPI-SDFR-AT-0127]
MRLSTFVAMLFSNSVWAMYGIGVAPRTPQETICVSCTFVIGNSTTVLRSQPSPFETPLPVSREDISITPSFSTSLPQPTTKTATSPTNTIHYTDNTLNGAPKPETLSTDFAALSTAAKAGIITGVSIFFLIIFLILFELGYMRRKRRERALQRAIEEVERGDIEMHKSGSSEGSESKENMVLESRVEIVVDEESDVEEDEDGWEADGEWDDGFDDREVGVDRGRERGRCAMSLPRREY